MDYLKGKLELVKARNVELTKGNSGIVENSARIMEYSQRHLSAFATDDRTKRFINVIMGCTANIINDATSNNITLLNLEDNMKEVWKCISEMESEKK